MPSQQFSAVDRNSTLNREALFGRLFTHNDEELFRPELFSFRICSHDFTIALFGRLFTHKDEELFHPELFSFRICSRDFIIALFGQLFAHKDEERNYQISATAAQLSLNPLTFY